MNLGLIKYLKLWLSKNVKSPIYLTFFITTKCNAKCSYCFFWKNLNAKKNELTLEEVEKISKSMDDLLFLLLSGGEPFLRDDIDKIVELFYKNNNVRFIIIPTNGILTEKILEKTKIISKKCKNASILVSVSLDGPAEITDKTRGVKGVFERAIKTIKELNKLKKDCSNFGLGINITFNAINQHQVLDFYEYLKKEVEPDLISPTLIRGDPKEKFTKKINLEIYQKLQNKIEKDYLKKNSKGNLGFSELVVANRIIRAKMIYKTALENHYISPCYAGTLNAILYPEGNVAPCEILNDQFGNIRDYNYDFKKLWGSEKVKQFRKNIIMNKCFCTHECNWTTNILFNPFYFPKILFVGLKKVFEKVKKGSL